MIATAHAIFFLIGKLLHTDSAPQHAFTWRVTGILMGIWTTRPKDNSPRTISPRIY